MDDRKGELEQKYLDYYFPKILKTISQVWSRNTMTLTWFCHCYAPNAWTSIFQLKWISGEFFSSCYLVVPTYQHFSTVINIAELGSIVDSSSTTTRINRTHIVCSFLARYKVKQVTLTKRIQATAIRWTDDAQHEHSAHREPKNTRVRSTTFCSRFFRFT